VAKTSLIFSQYVVGEQPLGDPDAVGDREPAHRPPSAVADRRVVPVVKLEKIGRTGIAEILARRQKAAIPPIASELLLQGAVPRPI
jgi:hypothetical protein